MLFTSPTKEKKFSLSLTVHLLFFDLLFKICILKPIHEYCSHDGM